MTKTVRLKSPVEMYGYHYPSGTSMEVVSERELAYELRSPHGQVGTLLKEYVEVPSKPKLRRRS